MHPKSPSLHRFDFLRCSTVFVRFRHSLTSALIAAGCCLAPLAGHAQGGIPGYAVVPLDLIGTANQATMRVTINGESALLMLDTGASTTVLDSRFYKGVRSQPGSVGQDQLPPEIPRRTKANGESAEIGTISSMQAGGMNFGTGPVVVLDLSHMVARYNNLHGSSQIAGLLGEDILRRYAAIIDWRRRGVYFNFDSSKRVKLGPGLTQSGWTAVPMQPSRPLTGRATMIGLDSAVNPATVENWKIGNYAVSSWNVGVQALPPNLLSEESAGEGPVLGLLGAEFLAANNAIIDIAGSTLYLKPRSR